MANERQASGFVVFVSHMCYICNQPFLLAPVLYPDQKFASCIRWFSKWLKCATPPPPRYQENMLFTVHATVAVIHLALSRPVYGTEQNKLLLSNYVHHTPYARKQDTKGDKKKRRKGVRQYSLVRLRGRPHR